MPALLTLLMPMEMALAQLPVLIYVLQQLLQAIVPTILTVMTTMPLSIHHKPSM